MITIVTALLIALCVLGAVWARRDFLRSLKPMQRVCMRKGDGLEVVTVLVVDRGNCKAIVKDCKGKHIEASFKNLFVRS